VARWQRESREFSRLLEMLDHGGLAKTFEFNDEVVSRIAVNSGRVTA